MVKFVRELITRAKRECSESDGAQVLLPQQNLRKRFGETSFPPKKNILWLREKKTLELIGIDKIIFILEKLIIQTFASLRFWREREREVE